MIPCCSLNSHHVPTSGPLHLLLPLPGKPFLSRCSGLLHLLQAFAQMLLSQWSLPDSKTALPLPLTPCPPLYPSAPCNTLQIRPIYPFVFALCLSLQNVTSAMQ